MDGSCRPSSSECFCSCWGFPSWPCLRCLSSPKSLQRKHKVGSFYFGTVCTVQQIAAQHMGCKETVLRAAFSKPYLNVCRRKEEPLILCNVSPKGFSQGVRRSVGGLATILGPLWAGGLTNNLYIMLGVMLALLIMITVSRTQLIGAFNCIKQMENLQHDELKKEFNILYAYSLSCQEWHEKVDLCGKHEAGAGSRSAWLSIKTAKGEMSSVLKETPIWQPKYLFLAESIWEDWYHSHIDSFNINLQLGDC